MESPWIWPLPIAWITLKAESGHEHIESASCFYNGAADGNRRREGPGPAAQLHAPALALGLPAEGRVAACLRESREAVIHTATWQHRKRIWHLLQGEPAAAPEEELRPAPGVTCAQRLASAPVAFSCKVLQELSLGDGQVAFVLSIVGIHIARSVMVNGQVDSKLLQPIGSCDPSGFRLVAAQDEHTMVFPCDHDSSGRLVVPASEAILARIGGVEEKDIEYEPPLLPNLPHNPLKALIVPRPIGWISTRGVDGDNLSPYSFFGYLAPETVFFGAGGQHVDGGEKDAIRDARSSKAFCVNLVPWQLRIAMSASAAEVPHDVDEFDLKLAPGHPPEEITLHKGECKCIDAPYVRNAHLRLECELLELITLTEDDDVIAVGKVVYSTHCTAETPVASRGGYFNYFRIRPEDCFQPDCDGA